MDIVVYLALFVLGAVFLFSLFILIVMCKRRALASPQYFRSSSLRFSKLRNANMESIMQLSPLIAQVLDNNQWIYDVTGMLQHCVAILKLCHATTEKLSSVPLTTISAQLNDSILRATNRIVPRFDDLLRAMAASQVDIRILEARASSLVSACWALALPFTIVNCKNVEVIDGALKEMESHAEALRLVVEQAEQRFNEQQNNDLNQRHSPLRTIIEETSLMEPPPPPPPLVHSAPSNDEAPADPGNN
uniref:Transmembrane protein 98 n=2 Tax=Ascaris TaxID=6251 RepID=A0A9J2P0R4_ASCLU